MSSKKIVAGGLCAGLVFYGLSLLIWVLFKFLPIVPLAIAVPSQGLSAGWYIEHLLVSLFIGLLWGFGYAVYGKTRPGGWLYGASMYMVGLLPAFVANFVIAPPMRSVIFYGALVGLIGALLGGRTLAVIIKR